MGKWTIIWYRSYKKTLTDITPYRKIAFSRKRRTLFENDDIVDEQKKLTNISRDFEQDDVYLIAEIHEVISDELWQATQVKLNLKQENMNILWIRSWKDVRTHLLSEFHEMPMVGKECLETKLSRKKIHNGTKYNWRFLLWL